MRNSKQMVRVMIANLRKYKHISLKMVQNHDHIEVWKGSEKVMFIKSNENIDNFMKRFPKELSKRVSIKRCKT